MITTMETKDKALSLRLDNDTRERLQRIADKSYGGRISVASRAMLESGINSADSGASPVKYAGTSQDIQKLADVWDALPEDVKAKIRNLSGI